MPPAHPARGPHGFRLAVRGWLLALAVLGGGVGGAAAAPAPFTIEVRTLGRALTPAQRATVERAVARVAALITSPFEPVRVDADAGACDRALPALHETVRHLVIYVNVTKLDDDVYADAAPCDLHDRTFLPIYALINLNSAGLADLSRVDLLDTMIHETLHALGVGTLWTADTRVSIGGEQDDTVFLRTVGRTTYYTAPRALAAYRALGGRARPGIPLDPDAGHWAGNSVCSEILSGTAGEYTGRVNPLSPLTLAALQDLGYHVNTAAASPFRLPQGACPVE
ncbi:hypothetical protein HNQ07_000447 [Deinococcus metalli]|uniref:Peptidase n=1 Tax=Deinococcus metalli TaxID=1141878 RepID=A0A7W8NPM9_9DEIO|nr:hypothetical protein [Deinococcus metalli]MBB5375003.1 hypothetical protein [Deinococcus metalli]GHF32152.1 peptidase [Deinococcus metalli]